MSRTVIETLAERYSQLYVDPDSDGAEEVCRRIVRSGAVPDKPGLAHFTGNSRDSLSVMDTPAGPIEILTLFSRKDFETFLRIMAYHCRSVRIPETQGAATLIGIINWNKIRVHKSEFLQRPSAGTGKHVDWPEEFRRFTADKQNYTDTLIVLSVGPYSHTDAAAAGYDEKQWIEHSQIIRTFHECTHVICRRMYPDQIDAVWDELVADSIGIYAACGRFRSDLAELFLGIRDGNFIGGRLRNYVEAEADNQELNALAKKVSGVIFCFSQIYKEQKGTLPFDMIPCLQTMRGSIWKN